MFFKRILKRFIYRMRGEYTVEDLIKMGLTVGKNFNPQLHVTLDPSHCWLITIGDDVTIAPDVQVLAHDASTCAHLGYAKIGRVNIGNNVFIGAGSVILPGVTVGDNVVVGAGSVVSRSLDGGYVYAGNPAKKICSIDEFCNKNKELMQTVPVYGEEYTLRAGISDEKKNEQKKALENSVGFVK